MSPYCKGWTRTKEIYLFKLSNLSQSGRFRGRAWNRGRVGRGEECSHYYFNLIFINLIPNLIISTHGNVLGGERSLEDPQLIRTTSSASRQHPLCPSKVGTSWERFRVRSKFSKEPPNILGGRGHQASLWCSRSTRALVRRTSMPRRWGSAPGCLTTICRGVTTVSLQVEALSKETDFDVFDCLRTGVGDLNQTSYRQMDLGILESFVSKGRHGGGFRDSIRESWTRIKDTTKDFFRNFG